jgi:uncharacterized protein YndB with AHSA1/START domain
MKKATFVYVVYIVTTPEVAWKALTQGDVTRQYWGNENLSDWKPGSKWDHVSIDGSHTVLITGKVLEIKPPRRLVLSWAFPAEAADPAKQTRVTFELDPIENMVRLTVTHDELDEGSSMQKGIVEGWPRVLSSLKSFLETGRALNTWAGKR